MANNTNSANKPVDFKKKHSKEEMKQQVITFALMIMFTLVAFGLVLAEVTSFFVIPILIILAIVQVLFQLYYFMHMKNKGHSMVSVMMFGGISIGILTIITFTTIIWW
ncbi:cytochrome c oxidase subunit IVB [Thalassobacillus sp. CUG 92003]|uniref:cytochrome c oxidase subunit IVB n=1 Tax=Thalassobacillus sp. CUG 92003 TaxID=2736641 RepID=UPI0015E6476F|nr:cytochrome c oxidase subunit IVB [Thalassobacillus sp. CUG 92003]